MWKLIFAHFSVASANHRNALGIRRRICNICDVAELPLLHERMLDLGVAVNYHMIERLMQCRMP